MGKPQTTKVPPKSRDPTKQAKYHRLKLIIRVYGPTPI